jgi:uncharacterized protein YlxP (DUF503 family)
LSKESKDEMRVGIVTILLYLDSHSLKEKRAVIKSLFAKLRSQFNVSVTEIDRLNNRRSAKICVALVSRDGSLNNRILANLVKAVSKHRGVLVEDYQIEIL